MDSRNHADNAVVHSLVQIAIRGRFEKGYSELEMAGLWLTDVDIVSRRGGFNLLVSEPTVVPIESLTVDGRMGAFLSRTLGNASPRRMEVHQGMGAMKMDHGLDAARRVLEMRREVLNRLALTDAQRKTLVARVGVWVPFAK